MGFFAEDGGLCGRFHFRLLILRGSPGWWNYGY